MGAGKSRHDGALAGLGHFAVPDAPALVDEYAERKRQKVMAPIEAREFQAFSDGVRLLLDADKGAGVRVAAASSSKNANLILGKLRLDELADEYGMAYDWIEPGQTLLDLPRPRHLGPDVQTGQAAPGDLLDRLPRARRRAAVLLRRRGRRLRRDGGEGRGMAPGHCAPRRHSAATLRPGDARSLLSASPAPTSWSQRSTM